MLRLDKSRRLDGGGKLTHLLDVIKVLVRRDFLGRYKHTSIGMLWSVLNPLFFLLIFYMVFAQGLGLLPTPKLTGIFIGILTWQWVQLALNQAASSITGNPNLVGQPGFPITVMPVIATITALVNFIIAMPILFGFLLFEGSAISLTMLWLPAIIAIQFIFILSLSYLVAALNVHFRDVEQILPIMLQLGYFVSPIFYELGSLTSNIRIFVFFNPVTHIVESYRDILLRQEQPNVHSLLVLLILSLVVFAMAFTYFRSARSRFLEEL